MPRIETSLVIDAPRAQVFAAFLDKARWHEYSAMKDLDASRPMAMGRRFSFSLKLPGLPRVPLLVKVVRFEPDRELMWTGRVPGFGGEHYFRFSDAPGGGTLLVHGEEFFGVFGHALVALRRDALVSTYAAFNRGLARHLGVGSKAA